MQEYDIQKTMTDNNQVEDLIKCNISSVDPNKCTCLKTIHTNAINANSNESFRSLNDIKNIAHTFLEKYTAAELQHFSTARLKVMYITRKKRRKRIMWFP